MRRRVLRLAVAGAAALGFCQDAAAVESEQICQAATLHARAADADVGLWLDRQTRHDGIQVVCNIRTVQFRRFLNVHAPASSWHARKAEEWNSINCSDRVWRIAIDDGWMIMETITTPSGEHADMIATCN
jgi:hypothetical protein